MSMSDKVKHFLWEMDTKMKVIQKQKTTKDKWLAAYSMLRSTIRYNRMLRKTGRRW